MRIETINQNNPDQQLLYNAVELLKNGKAIIHPTETVYGLAGDFSSKSALQEIMRLKSRYVTQPFSIMVNSLDQILDLMGKLPKWIEHFLNIIFPDAITVLLPRRSNVSLEYWNQFSLIGFRFPNHKISNLLVSLSNKPLITTSANLSGEPPPIEISNINKELINQVPLTLNGGITKEKIPSTIIRIDENKKKVFLVRSGAVDWKIIEKRFGESL